MSEKGEYQLFLFTQSQDYLCGIEIPHKSLSSLSYFFIAHNQRDIISDLLHLHITFSSKRYVVTVSNEVIAVLTPVIAVTRQPGYSDED